MANVPVTDAAAQPATKLSLARVAIGIVALIALLVIGRAAGSYVPRFAQWVNGLGVWGPMVFIAGYVVATVAFVPGSLLTLAAGAIFGLAAGVCYVLLAATLGAATAFLVSRYVARHAIERRLAGNPKFTAIDRAVGAQGLKIVFLLRLSPVFPFNLLNYGLGLTQVRFADYLIASLAMLPGTVLYVYYGKLAGDVAALAGGAAPEKGAGYYAVLILGLAATVVVTTLVTRTARRALKEATDDDTVGALPTAADAARGQPLVAPLDVHNQRLLESVHPQPYRNPTPSSRYNLVVVGAGTAGLVTAAAAAGLGAKVALVERHLMGGDCLNVGCVPSKSLIRAARMAHDVGRAAELGVRVPAGARVDFPAVMERMRRLRADLSRNDSVQRYGALGVDVYIGTAQFSDRDHVEVDGRRLEFARAAITTGARAARLPVPGLEAIDYLTNENVFWLTELPRRLVVLGAGPIGCELGQAFRRFGSEVTILSQAFLPKEEQDTAELVEASFRRDGVVVNLGATIMGIGRRGAEKVITYEVGGERREAVADQVLLGAGRAANVEGLGLEAAGVEYSDKGVRVDDYLRTTNPHIYAAGDICSRFQFTHAADAMARMVVQNALFFGRKKASALTIPWCTYTDPEVAHVGLNARDATAAGIEVSTLTIELKDVDRAMLDAATDGFARAVVRKGSDTLVGLTLVAEHAGEMIGEAVLAMTQRIGLGTFAGTIHPYPTQAEVLRKLGDSYNRTRLTPTVKRLFERLLAWRR